MLSRPQRPEIAHRTMKLIVGLIALTLANLTSFFAQTAITSISASYYEGGWSQVIFVGFLFAISTFLLAYNGYSTSQMLLSKAAAIAGVCIALFPCGCDSHAEIVPHVHAAAAAVMFGILAYFCYIFYGRAQAKGHAEAKRRALIYGVCGLVIVVAILTLAVDSFTNGVISARVPRLTFYGEKYSLIAFAVSWLTASHCLPVITTKTERFSPLR